MAEQSFKGTEGWGFLPVASSSDCPRDFSSTHQDFTMPGSIFDISS